MDIDSKDQKGSDDFNPALEFWLHFYNIHCFPHKIKLSGLECSNHAAKDNKLEATIFKNSKTDRS